MKCSMVYVCVMQYILIGGYANKNWRFQAQRGINHVFRVKLINGSIVSPKVDEWRNC